MANSVLGRGLSALIPNKSNLEVSLRQMPIGDITPNPNQPRTFNDDQSFLELVNSVKQFGVLQPLIVKEKNGGFEIVAGERRYRAALTVGIQELPVVVKKVKNELESFEIALIENIQRQDLSPLEEARAYRYLMDDCKVSQEKLARQLGKSRSYIANAVRLLSLNESVQQLIETGRLSAGHARALVTLDAKKQIAMAEKIINDGLSVRQVEALISEKKITAANINQRAKNSAAADDFSFLEEELSKKMQTKVKIKSHRSKGRIEIFFSNYKELSKIKKKLL